MKDSINRYLPTVFLVTLLVWGLYSLFYYLGVQVHMSVLLKSSSVEWIQEMCDGGGEVCRGMFAVFPLLARVLERLQPMLWFTVLSALTYGGWVLWRKVRDGRIESRFKLTPLKVILLFFLALWFVHISISVGNVGNASVRRIVEPTPQVYSNVSDEGLERLQSNFEDLQQRNCLHHIGQFNNGAQAYNIKTSCVQWSFITKVGGGFLFALLFFLELLVLGRAALSLFRFRLKPLFLEAGLSLGLGAAAWIVLLWVFAVFGFYKPAVGWSLLAVVPILGVKHTAYWIRKCLWHRWTVERKWYDPGLVLAWIFVAYLALNFITVIRPFPIGWDDLGSYMNRPRMLVDFGYMIYSMATFQWEYLTSIGFLLFGVHSSFGSSVAMVINWSAGLFAALTVYLIGSTFFGERRGLLAAVVYYTLPLVGHFSFADMKIDNAVFLMGALATLCIFLYLFPRSNDEESSPDRSLHWIILAGIFGGFAFGIKATAVMVIVALGSMLVSVLIHWSAFVGMFFFATALFAKRGLFNINTITNRIFDDPDIISQSEFLFACVALGAAFVVSACWKRLPQTRSALVASGVFVATFIVAIAPWLLHNSYLHGRFNFALGAPNTQTPLLQIGPAGPGTIEGQTVKSLPPELYVDQSHPACEPTGHIEELDRYWGHAKGWSHYITLPWRTVMNLDSVGYYVTTNPALLLFPLLLLIPLFWIREKKWLRWMTLMTFLILYEWMFLANGVPWYGIGVFLGLALGLEALFVYAPDRISKIVVGLLIGVSIVMNLNQRFWQFDQQRNLYEYVLGKVNRETLMERTIPHYNDIADIVTIRAATLPDRPYLYRIGTFIPYFIPRSLEVIAATDHQLDLFNCLYQERDPQLTVQRLKALGFNSIVFDTNTATIEKDSEGSLHQKVNAFINFVNNPEAGLRVVIHDLRAGVSFLLIP